MRRRKSISTVTRRTTEQDRRNQMKDLFCNLNSVLHLPIQPSMGRMTVPAFLEYARVYVNTLKERVTGLKKTKEDLVAGINKVESNLPIVAVNEMDSALEVNLIVGTNRNLALSEVLSILEEEGADVLSVNYSTRGYKIVHTIICQAILARIGIDASIVLQRLNELVFEGRQYA